MLWLIVFATLLVLLYLFSYANTFRPVIREVEMTVAKDGGFDELRIVQLSDLHMERQSIAPRRLAHLIADTRPDLIVLTGDYMDRYDSLDKFMTYLDAINQVPTAHGVWLVWGNHDHYLGHRIEDLQELIEAKGIRVLVNESDTISFGEKRLNIIGIDDYCLGKSNIDRSFEGVTDGVNLVLSHDPNIVLAFEAHHDVDYMLSGHFHGGQFKIPGGFKLFPMGELPKVNVISGLHTVNGKKLYISEGMGQVALNVRFGTRPEITVHTLRSAA
ncbi:MAG TPA: metallophosphoesterase [Bacilli bacterium]|nr:metallophosphoesterase [Bacilli bacterium]